MLGTYGRCVASPPATLGLPSNHPHAPLTPQQNASAPCVTPQVWSRPALSCLNRMSPVTGSANLEAPRRR